MAQRNLLKGFKKPKKLEFEQNNITDCYGKFSASPFEPGFGTTIGNSLRRILLSSIQGYAVSFVTINSYNEDSVAHTISSEFENIKGVPEDTIEVLNKLKQIRLRLPEDVESDTFTFEFKGPIEVKSDDFEVDGRLEILNKGLHVMTLMQDAHVQLELQVDLGRGYVPAEVNLGLDEDKKVIGPISIDRIFSPVLKVSYSIEPCRVFQRNDYDKLILEVWTDGTIRPENALAEAAKIAKDHFTIFINFNEDAVCKDDADDATEKRLLSILDTPIERLELAVRARNVLEKAEVKTLGALAKMTEDDIASMRNLGKKSLTEIQEKLREYNLELGMTDFSQLKNTIKLSKQKEETDEA